MTIELTVGQRTFLKSLAQKVKPTVWIGKNGVNEELLSAIDQALEAAELVKVKVLEGAPEDRKAVAPVLAKALDCALVQVIGRMVVLYRPRKKDPAIVLP